MVTPDTPPITDADLARMLGEAERATNTEWTAEFSSFGGPTQGFAIFPAHSVGGLPDGMRLHSVASANVAERASFTACYSSAEIEANATHIANFDPPTAIALLTELRDRRAADEWHDMSSAPRDGTTIHVWRDGWRWPEVAYWEVYDAETADEVGETGYWAYAETLLNDHFDPLAGLDAPTHWRAFALPTSEYSHE